MTEELKQLREALRPAAQAGEREAFEAEMRCEETWGHRSLKKRPDGRYQNWQVDVMWDVWQARALRPQAVPMSRDDLKVLMSAAGYVHASTQEKADFINGFRNAEVHHGITAPAGGEG